MTIVRNTISDVVIKKWDEYKKSLQTYFNESNKFISEHTAIIRANGNPGKLEFINQLIPFILKLYKIKDGLNIINKKFTGNVFYLDEIHTRQQNLIFYIYQLNKMLADKYMFLVRGTVKIHDKKEYTAEAIKYIEMAKTIFHEFDNATDAEFDDFYERIYETYNAYHYNDKLDAIQKLLFSARTCKDRELAFLKFQEALNLLDASDQKRKFSILREQGENYFEIAFDLDPNKINKQDVLNHQAIIRTVSNSYISAAKIQLVYPERLQSMLLASRGICIDLFRFARHFLALSNFELVTKDLTLRENLLADAEEYEQYANALSIYIKETFNEFADTKALILSKKEKLSAEKIEIENEKIEKETQKKLLQKLEQEYQEKFADILKSFQDEEIEDSEQEQTEASTVVDIQHVGSLGIPEEEELIPIYITYDFKQERLKKSDLIHLNDQLKLLEDAKQNQNLVEQVRITVNIAEFHRIEAIRLLKRGNKRVPSAIEKLEITKEQLNIAINLIQQIKDNKLEITQPIEDWANTILKHTEELLAKTINHQKNIKERFDRGHDEAMKYIIETYGEHAWFKFTDYLWENLSLPAQIRSITKENIDRLTVINTDISHIKQRLQQINDDGPLPHEVKNMLKYGHFYAVFFNPKGERHSPLRRSESCESFFDLVESAVRESNRKDYGR